MSKSSPIKHRVEVMRQEEFDHPRTQAPHTMISQKLDEVWRVHFSDSYGTATAGIELGMLLILYLTGSSHVGAERIASLLTRTYPGVTESISSNVSALLDALGVAQE